MVPIVRGIGDIFVFRQWPRLVKPTRYATEGVLHPHLPLRSGRPKDKHNEDDHHGMPYIPYAWPDVLRSLRAADDEYGTNLLVTTADKGGLPRVRGGGHSGVSADSPSYSTRRG